MCIIKYDTVILKKPMQTSVLISETFIIKSFSYSPSVFFVLLFCQGLKQLAPLVSGSLIHGPKCSSEAAGVLKMNCGTETCHGLSPVY